MSDILNEQYPGRKGNDILGDVYIRLGNPDYSWEQTLRLKHEDDTKEDRTIYLVKLPKNGLALVGAFDEKSQDKRVQVYSPTIFLPSGLRLPNQTEKKERPNHFRDQIHIALYESGDKKEPDCYRVLGFDLNTGKFQHEHLTEECLSELDETTDHGLVTGSFKAVEVPPGYKPGDPFPRDS